MSVLRGQAATAALCLVSEATLRTWKRRQQVQPVACDTRTRALLFDVEQVAAYRETRRRAQEVDALSRLSHPDCQRTHYAQAG